jgi:hypothetical protein
VLLLEGNMRYAIAVCISPNSFSTLSSPSKLWSVPPDLAHLAGGDIGLCPLQLHFLADGDRAHVRYYLSLARKDMNFDNPFPNVVFEVHCLYIDWRTSITRCMFSRAA